MRNRSVTVVYVAVSRNSSSFQEGLTSFVSSAVRTWQPSLVLLITEIDAATFAGRNTNALVSECTEISGRMLDRAQSAELGF